MPVATWAAAFFDGSDRFCLVTQSSEQSAGGDTGSIRKAKASTDEPLESEASKKENLEENANGPMIGATTQKIASLLPPPPLLIRPTPVSQSRESIVLNNNGKFWNHGDQIYHI